MFILGISGRRHSGKTTLAKAMLNTYPFAEITGIAHPMKKFVADLYNIDITLLEDEAFKETLIPGTQTKWRQPLIDMGALFNGYGGMPFTEYAKRRIESVSMKPWIIADIRRAHEVVMIQQLGGRVVRLQRNPHNDETPVECVLDTYQGFDLVIPEGTSVEDSANLVKGLLLR